MKIFLSGGAKNGKSSLAQHISKHLAGEGPLFYVATMIPHDAEDEQRIARHLKEREGWGFETVESGMDVATNIIAKGRNGSFLFDSVTALLSNEMFPGPEPDLTAPERVRTQLLQLADWAEHIVFVSDFIYADAGQYDPLTEAYRKGLADIDRALAQHCDVVAELCGGCPLVYKGELPV